MNKQITFLSIFLSALMLPQLAHAEIYKHVDAEGRITYSNVKIKGAKKLQLEPADTNFGTDSSGEKKRTPSTRTATPASFPKVDEGTQNQRDGKRKEILQSELDGEKKALENAKKAYEEGASNPEVYKTKDGKTMRNVPKFDEKMKGLQAEVDAHQRNIELLEKEISNIN
ncbi:MAG: DUF4124 domain-containing protein [Methylotenera sp.]